MLKPRVIVLFSALLVAVLAAGSAYALSADEAGRDSGDVSALQEPTPTAQAQDDDDEDGDDATEAAEHNDVDDEASDGPGNGGIVKADLLAAEFGVSSDAVLALHDQGIGWGALFKLYAFARAKGVTVDDLIAAAPTDASGEEDFAFGEMKKSLTPEQAAVLADGPKNLGPLVSGNHKNSHKDNADPTP